MTELRRPAPLDARRHERTGFESGDLALDGWLQRYAGQNRRRDTAATWVIADAADRIVAYASIAMTGIDLAAAPSAVAKGSTDPLPALLLGRLAVDRRHTGRGLGTALVAHVLATAVDLNAQAACRVVVVPALHSEARRWWQRIGFEPFAPADSESLDLYLLTADIEATLARLGQAGP